MNLSHQTHRTRSRARGRSRRREQGYSIVMVSLLIIPLMSFTALGVDVASWYSRGLEIQRAADAAAMAGVVWLPNDLPMARSEARRVAARNGFAHDPDGTGITVDVEPVPGRPQELDVTVRDPHVPSYFGRVVMDDITLTRAARARYVLPVPLGSPFNFFGNTPGRSHSPQPRLFPHIQAPYTRYADGDPFTTKCAGNARNHRECSGGMNPDYRPEGYLYIVDVPPEGVGRTLTVEVYDASWDPGAVDENAGDRWLSSSGTRRQPALQYELYRTDPTPLDPTDNPSMAGSGQCTSGTGRIRLGNSDTSPDNDWRVLCRFTVSQAGQYPLRVRSSGIPTTTDQGTGSAGYSLVATLSGGGKQPQLYAHADMSIQTAFTGTSTLYLAEVAPEHAGKSFRIELFDPGDGNSGDYFLNIIEPDGSRADCSYSLPGGGFTDVGSCRIQTRSSGGNQYQGEWLTIDISLPPDYECDDESTTGCWWRMQYELEGEPTDRTVWRASVLGDPVQLIR